MNAVRDRSVLPPAEVRPEDLVVGGLSFLAGVVVLVESVPRYVGRQATFGPGAFPTWVALVLLVCGLSVLAKLVRQRRLAPSPEWPQGAGRRRLVAVAASLVLYQALLPVVGFWLASSLLLLFHFRALGSYPWRVAAPVALGAALLLTYVFGTLLFMPLPSGWLGW